MAKGDVVSRGKILSAAIVAVLLVFLPVGDDSTPAVADGSLKMEWLLGGGERNLTQEALGVKTLGEVLAAGGICWWQGGTEEVCARIVRTKTSTDSFKIFFDQLQGFPSGGDPWLLTYRAHYWKEGVGQWFAGSGTNQPIRKPQLSRISNK
ncbi:MAG: hypothetical protein KBD16_00465 [Candidatus Pacebacteria bacterium]|nr:hypothetical protein [Candidatus Paceibacterota bacterium]